MFKQKHTIIKSKIPLLLSIVFFTITFFINSDFDVRFLYNYVFFAALILCEFLIQRRIRVSKITVCYFLLVTSVTVFSILPNAYLDLEAQNHTISMLLFFSCFLFTYPSARELKISNTLLLTAAFLMAIYIISVKISPDLFWDNVYPYLSKFSQDQAQRLMRLKDYGAIIGGSAIFADYIMAMAVFICLAGCFSGRILLKNNIKFYAVSFLFIIAMIIENRRGELIATIISVLSMYFISARNFDFSRFNLQRAVRFFSICLAMFVTVVLLSYVGLLDRYIGTFTNISGGTEKGIEEAGTGRVILWATAISMYESSSKLIGIGWNQFRARNVLGGLEGMHVHNDYLQWLCETGVIGFSLIFGLTFYIWFENIRRCKRVFNIDSILNSKVKCYALISFSIQTFFMILHLVDPSFYKLLFWPIYSYSMVMYRMSVDEEKRIANYNN